MPESMGVLCPALCHVPFASAGELELSSPVLRNDSSRQRGQMVWHAISTFLRNSKIGTPQCWDSGLT